jgi:hypothetical protein
MLNVIKMKKNKKAIFYSVTVLILTIFILVAALTAAFNKTKHEKKIGEEQIELIKKYQEGEDVLFYIEQSAKYSVYNVMYSFAKKGIYFNEPLCKYNLENGDYVMWENVIQDKDTQCYPLERDFVINFALFLNNHLDKYFEKHPSVIIPKNNYDFNFNEKEGGIDIKGVANQNIIFAAEDSDYSLKPSFRTKISYNFISKFTKYSTKAQEIRDNIQKCLGKGSNTPDDEEDLLTCSDINKLKKDIEGIEGYEIIPVAFPKEYTLLFDIEDKSFENPYSDEKLVIKYGIRFMDVFAPPATEIIGIEEGVLKWKKNNASDVVGYRIYARTLKPSDIAKRDFVITVGKETEWKVEYDEDCLEKEKEDKVCLKKGEKYWFYIVAHDNADKIAETISPTEITI